MEEGQHTEKTDTDVSVPINKADLKAQQIIIVTKYVNERNNFK